MCQLGVSDNKVDQYACKIKTFFGLKICLTETIVAVTQNA